MARTNPAVALAVAILGVGVFATMDAVMKRLTLANGVYPVLLWRNLAGAAICGVPFAMRREWPDRAAMRIHLERGAITAAMALLFFWGLTRTPLARAVALTFIAPIAALFLARLLLGERLRPLAIAGSVLALGGVGVILSGQTPGAAGPEALPGALAVLGSAVCYAYNIILMRRQSQLSGPLEIAFFQNLVIALILAAGAPFVSPALVHDGQWPLILVAAILATVSLLLLGWAYAHAEASYLATSEFSAFIWSASLGWLVFGERLTRATLIGALLIVAGCLIATRRHTTDRRGDPHP